MEPQKWRPLAEIFPEKLLPEFPVPVPRRLLRRDRPEVRRRGVEEERRPEQNRSKFPKF